MKKKIVLLATVILLCFTAFNSKASVIISNGDTGPLTKEAIAKMTSDQRHDRLEAIKARIKEIKKIDKSQMSEEDRKQLKAELKSLRHESGQVGDDIVLSTAGAIVVVLGLLLSGAI